MDGFEDAYVHLSLKAKNSPQPLSNLFYDELKKQALTFLA